MPISPKYHALYTQLRRDITDGKLPPHTQLPTEDTLCRSHHVSRGTVRKALDILASEGVIRREQGRGVFVNPPSLTLLPFTLIDPAPTLEIRTLRAEVMPANADLAARLDISINTPVIVIAQVRTQDGLRVMYEARALPQSLAPDLIHDDFSAQPVHWLLTHKYKLPLVRATYTVEARALNAVEAERLAVEVGTPAFTLDRVTYTAAGGTGTRPAVWYQALCRMDYLPFKTEFQGII